MLGNGFGPPAGQKTRIKVTVNIDPPPGTTDTCLDEPGSDPVNIWDLSSVGNLIVQQK